MKALAQICGWVVILVLAIGQWVTLMLLLVLAIGALAVGSAIGWVETRTDSPLVGAIVLGGLLVLWLWTAIYVVGGAR